MAVVDFTSYGDIRAALGVSVDEIEDATISLALYEDNLMSEFEDVNLGLVAAYKVLAEEPASDYTDAEERFVRYTRLFATYAVARHLTDSLPMFGPKEISDGKALQTRFTQDPYKVTMQRVADRYQQYRSRLVAAFEAIQAGSAGPQVTLTTFVVSSPASDPVTGT